MKTQDKSANAQLRDRLGEGRAKVTALRDERATLKAAFEQAKAAYVSAGIPAEGMLEAPEYKAAEQAKDRLEACDKRLQAVQDEELAVLRLLGGDTPAPGANGPSATGAHLDAVETLKGTPGLLLASMLESRKQDITRLPNHLRFSPSPAMAAEPVLTTEEFSTEAAEGEAIIDLLTPNSVALASGINVLKIDTTKKKVPRFTDLPQASWIPELGAFPKSGPGVDLVDVEPPKVGLVTGISIEVFEDLSPMMLAMIQVQLLRSIALEFDRGILFGDPDAGDPEDVSPVGVANTTGIAEPAAVPPMSDLSAFADAIGTLFVANARPGALAMNPRDVARLLSLVEFTGASESNVPLWKDAIGGPSGLTLPYFKVPIWPTEACPQRTALLYDPATIVAVVRREADIAVDPFYGFDNGEVGLRTYLRGDVVVAHPEGAVKITWSAT